MESVQYLQQIPCTIFHHTLIMLLRYLRELNRFKFGKNIEQTANEMYWFLHAHILIDHAYLLITYLFITSVYGLS